MPQTDQMIFRFRSRELWCLLVIAGLSVLSTAASIQLSPKEFLFQNTTLDLTAAANTSSPPPPTSLLTLTFDSNFTIDPITYTPTVVLSPTLTTLTTTIQGEVLALTTTTYIPVPTNDPVFRTAGTQGQNHFTLQPLTYTPTYALVPGVTTVTATDTKGLATSYTSPIVWYVKVSQPDQGGLSAGAVWGIMIASYVGFCLLCCGCCKLCQK